MNIALIGYGKMGQLLHRLAEARGHSIVAICCSSTPLSVESSLQAISDADVCLDFSSPDSVLTNVLLLAKLNKNVVIGTTGWIEHLPAIQTLVTSSKIGLLHSPNFSLGIALFLKLIGQAGALISPFAQYEVGGIEMHHSQKLDCPSGTAHAIASNLNLHYPHPPSFSSVRLGNIPGTHSVIFDSPVDTITLTHTARNREGFAHGAIIAAEWLHGKQGIFTLDDLLQDTYK